MEIQHILTLFIILCNTLNDYFLNIKVNSERQTGNSEKCNDVNSINGIDSFKVENRYFSSTPTNVKEVQEIIDTWDNKYLCRHDNFPIILLNKMSKIDK